MIDFFGVLGMARLIHDPGGEWAVLQGRSGRVAVHEARETHNGAACFEFGDIDATTAALRANGLDVTTWDESYGHHLGVRDHRGGGIWLNEIMKDTHGYLSEQPHPGRVDVISLDFTTDFAAARDFYARLGFTAGGPESDDYQELTASPTSGVVALHCTSTEPALGAAVPDDPMAPPAPPVGIGFNTVEDPLLDRLLAAGHRAVRESDPDHLVVIDPDGVRTQIHPARDVERG